jgi:hypothetical protein
LSLRLCRFEELFESIGIDAYGFSQRYALLLAPSQKLNMMISSLELPAEDLLVLNLMQNIEAVSEHIEHHF